MKLTNRLHPVRKLGNLAATTPRPNTSVVASFFLIESQIVLLICRPQIQKMGRFLPCNTSDSYSGLYEGYCPLGF